MLSHDSMLSSWQGLSTLNMYNLIHYYCSVLVSVFSLSFTSPFSIRSGISSASQGRYQMRRERRRGGVEGGGVVEEKKGERTGGVSKEES